MQLYLLVAIYVMTYPFDCEGGSPDFLFDRMQGTNNLTFERPPETVGNEGNMKKMTKVEFESTPGDRNRFQVCCLRRTAMASCWELCWSSKCIPELPLQNWNTFPAIARPLIDTDVLFYHLYELPGRFQGQANPRIAQYNKLSTTITTLLARMHLPNIRTPPAYRPHNLRNQD